MCEDSPLLGAARRAIRLRGLSRKTESAYTDHIRRFLEFYAKRNLARVSAKEVCVFVERLAADARYSEATRNQAACALRFFYRDVLKREFAASINQISPRRKRENNPIFFTDEEAKAVLAQMSGAPFLAAALVYGAGLRLVEALNLRVGDVCFERGEIVVRDALTGAKKRATVLPKSIRARLEKHLAQVRLTHEDDCLRGFGAADLPPAIFGKYPNAAREWRWQFVFPACRLTAAAGESRRRHLAEATVQKAIGEALRSARVVKKIGCQSLRRSFAARLFEKNTDARTIQNLLGHRNLKTTMSCVGILDGGGKFQPQSPLDY